MTHPDCEGCRKALEALTKERDDEKRRVAEQISEMGTLRFRAEKAEAALAEMKASREAEQRVIEALREASTEFVRIYGLSKCRCRKTSDAGEDLECFHKLAVRGMKNADAALDALTAPAQKPEPWAVGGCCPDDGRKDYRHSNGLCQTEPRMFPMQKDLSDPALRGKPNPSLPWEVAEAIFKHIYAPLHGLSQSLERLAERGGFSYEEIRILADDLARSRRRLMGQGETR